MSGNKNLNKRAFIFMGGKNFFPQYLTDTPQQDDLIIAADSGLSALEQYCEIKKISPDVIVGDMDSFEENAIYERFPDAHFTKFPPEKDDTDTALAVDIALQHGCDEIFILGGIGGRFDHTLAVTFLCEYITEKGAIAVISDGKNRIYLAKKKNVIQSKRKYISLIPIDKKVCGVSFYGFKYPIENKEILRQKPLTVSNELCEKTGEISVKLGNALIIESMD